MNLSRAPARDVRNLQNWVDGTGSLASDETAYLGHPRDLAGLVPPGDRAISQLESWIEDGLIWSYKGFRRVRIKPSHAASSLCLLDIVASQAHIAIRER